MIKTKTPQKTNTTQTNNTKLMAHLGTVGEEVYGKSMKSQNFFLKKTKVYACMYYNNICFFFCIAVWQ